jgi:hypothetical protein
MVAIDAATADIAHKFAGNSLKWESEPSSGQKIIYEVHLNEVTLLMFILREFKFKGKETVSRDGDFLFSGR